jgi:hypothetical protein
MALRKEERALKRGEWVQEKAKTAVRKPRRL